MQIRRRGKTRREAKSRVESALRELLDEGISHKMSHRKAFEVVAKEWLEFYTHMGKKRGTIRIREKEINLLNRFMAKANIQDLSYKYYQRLLNNLAKEGYARNTISGVHKCAGMIFEYAKKEKYIKVSPTKGAIVPKKASTVEEIENQNLEEGYLEMDELNEFLKTVHDHGLPLDLERFYLLDFSGIRPGELCALKESDYNPKTKEIKITKMLYNERNNMKTFELVPPKTTGSIRAFVIDDMICTMIESHLRKQKLAKMTNQKIVEDYQDFGFLFCRPNGYPFVKKNLLDRMNRILSKTKITKHATPHIFRHTHISMLAAAGVDIADIMKRVGHDDMKTTLNIYTHVTNKMKKETSSKLRVAYQDLLDHITKIS